MIQEALIMTLCSSSWQPPWTTVLTFNPQLCPAPVPRRVPSAFFKVRKHTEQWLWVSVYVACTWLCFSCFTARLMRSLYVSLLLCSLSMCCLHVPQMVLPVCLNQRCPLHLLMQVKGLPCFAGWLSHIDLQVSLFTDSAESQDKT